MLSRLFMCHKLRPFRRFRDRKFVLLDVGCGNGSPLLAKRWFPQCYYIGVDRENYNNSPQDIRAIDKFIQLDLSRDSLDELPNADAIVLAHVIEHLENGLEVLHDLLVRLKPGGGIYVETPNERSLSMPPGRNFLRFVDDPTHKRLYTVPDIANAMLAAGVSPVRGGTRRDWVKLVTFPVGVTYEVSYFARHGILFGPHLWDLVGNVSYVYGERPQ